VVDEALRPAALVDLGISLAHPLGIAVFRVGADGGVPPRFGGECALAVGLWEAERADWLIMGGYRRGPLVERLIGSTVNGVLNQARRPVLLVR